MLSRILLILLLVSAMSNALSQEKADSVAFEYLASEVFVVSTKQRVVDANSTIRNIQIDKSIQFKGNDLGTVLDRSGFSGVLVNGAPGASSALRFRGLASDHTMIYWQGLPLNSLSLGTCDLSLIPAFFSDQVAIISSSGTSPFANNNFGVSISLENHNVASEGGFIRSISSYNTLGNAFQGLDMKLVLLDRKSNTARVSNEKPFQTRSTDFKLGALIARVKVFGQDLKNEFQYLDIYQPGERTIEQVHNNGLNKGLTYDFEWTWKHGKIGIHQWLQSKDLLLPSQMGRSDAGTAEQHDSFVRSVIQYDGKYKKSEWNIASAYSYEVLDYRDKPMENNRWLIDSKVQSRSFFNRMNYAYHVYPGIALKSNLTGVFSQVENSNYSSGKADQNWLQSSNGISAHMGTHRVEADVRIDSRFAELRPAWSFNYSSSFTKWSFQLIPELQIARNIRVPDMNELFWVPGGNRDLKPESGMNYKCGLNIFSFFDQTNSAGITMRTYRTVVDDWIQWIPLSGNVWTPVNYKLVRTQGWELEAFYQWETSTMKLNWNGRVQQNSARTVNSTTWDDESAKVIAYTPRYTVFTDVQWSYGRWNFMLFEKYTSARFTEEHNLSYRMLPRYFLTGVEMGYTWKFSTMNIITHIHVDNLFNTQYESIRTFAMPGRIIQLNLQLELNLNKYRTK